MMEEVVAIGLRGEAWYLVREDPGVSRDVLRSGVRGRGPKGLTGLRARRGGVLERSFRVDLRLVEGEVPVLLICFGGESSDEGAWGIF
jgi:hypothetical protein